MSESKQFPEYLCFKQVVSHKYCDMIKEKIEKYSKKRKNRKNGKLQAIIKLSSQDILSINSALKYKFYDELKKINVGVKSLSDYITLTKRKSMIGWHLDSYIENDIPYKFFIQISDIGATNIYDETKKEIIEFHLEKGDILMFKINMIHRGGYHGNNYKYLLGFRLHIEQSNYSKEKHEYLEKKSIPIINELTN